MEAKQAVLHAAKQGSARYAGEQLALLERFSRIDHGTGDIEGNEKVIALMNEVYAGMDIEVEYPENPGKGRHVVARVRHPASTGKIIINSHIDTVFKPGDAAAHPFRIEGDYAYGLGIADCMGGFAVACYAVRILQEAGLLPAKDIVMIHNCDEETGSPNGRELFRREADGAEAAFVFEGARDDNGVLTYRKGFAAGQIEVIGKEAHAGLNYEQGRSATVELAHQILNLNAMNDPEKTFFYNVGPLSGGKGIATVAGYASAGISIPLPDMETYEKVKADMKKLEQNVMIDGCTVKASMELVFPTMDHTWGNILLYEHIRDIGRQLGQELPEQASGGCSDACYFCTYGVPTVDGLGPYLKSIHTFDERLLIPSIREKTELFAAVLGSL